MLEDPSGRLLDQAELAAALEITDRWPDATLIVRGDSYKAASLNDSLVYSPYPGYRPRLPGWSVQALPDKTLLYLCQPLPQTHVRWCTLGDVRSSGGWLAKTPGRHEHCTLGGI